MQVDAEVALLGGLERALCCDETDSDAVLGRTRTARVAAARRALGRVRLCAGV
jgi:hypothetical protein